MIGVGNFVLNPGSDTVAHFDGFGGDQAQHEAQGQDEYQDDEQQGGDRGEGFTALEGAPEFLVQRLSQ